MSDPKLRALTEAALRSAEAAEAQGIGERTLRQILPELPHVRIGGVVLLPVDCHGPFHSHRVRCT